MFMRLQHIEPHPQLKRHVGKMWIFEGSGRMLVEDMKLIVPNGIVKLVIPFRNGISGKYKDRLHLSKESSITIISI